MEQMVDRWLDKIADALRFPRVDINPEVIPGVA